MPSQLPPVEDLALLARLRLTPDEAERLGRQLEGILVHFASLQELDLEGVEPNPYAMDLRHVVRPDGPVEGVQALPRGTANLDANAPARREDFFEVPKILEA
ncbi:MAG: Asp-tRNA(Asn)/Glu-tRNA(Gln) amidotransferase subunit GatC [Planctomycetota bacterium]